MLILTGTEAKGSVDERRRLTGREELRRRRWRLTMDRTRADPFSGDFIDVSSKSRLRARCFNFFVLCVDVLFKFICLFVITTASDWGGYSPILVSGFLENSRN